MSKEFPTVLIESISIDRNKTRRLESEAGQSVTGIEHGSQCTLHALDDDINLNDLGVVLNALQLDSVVKRKSSLENYQVLKTDRTAAIMKKLDTLYNLRSQSVLDHVRAKSPKIDQQS